jgi:hypothetical protein
LFFSIIFSSDSLDYENEGSGLNFTTVSDNLDA